MLLEISNVPQWEKLNRYLIGSNGIELRDVKLVFTNVESWHVSLYEGCLFGDRTHNVSSAVQSYY